MNAAVATTPWWANLVTWALILAGWYAVHLATLARERRKERRELVQKTIEHLRELEVEALQFHTASSFDSVNADKLVYKTSRLIRSLQRAPMIELQLPVWRMVQVRRRISLSNCDKSSFQRQIAGCQFLLEIRAAIDDLIDSIEAARDACWK